MSLGEKLQKLRKARNLSQEELAAELSVTRQTVSKWELDQSTPELSLLAQISDIFGVTTDYLIKETTSDAAAPKKESISETEVLIARKLMTEKQSARLTLCIVLLCIGLAGMLLFYILSRLFPWSYNGIEGLTGYLMGTETTFLFVLCVLSMIAGLAGLIYLSVQERKKQA